MNDEPSKELDSMKRYQRKIQFKNCVASMSNKSDQFKNTVSELEDRIDAGNCILRDTLKITK